MNNGGNGNQKRMLTTHDVAQLLHVHPNTVRKWSNNGLLRAYRVGSRGDRRFEPEEIGRFLKESQPRLSEKDAPLASGYR